MNKITPYLYAIILLISIIAILPQGVGAREFEGGIVPANCRAGCPCTLCDLYQLGVNVVDFLLYGIAIPLATLSILWGGFKMLTAGGNMNTVIEGRTILTNTVVGMAFAFFGWVIINTILNTLAFQIPFTGGAWYKRLNCAPANAGSCEILHRSRPEIPPLDTPGVSDGFNTQSAGADTLIQSNGGQGQSWSTNTGDGPVPSFGDPNTNNAIAAAADKYDVDPARLKAIIAAESSNNPNAIHTDADGVSSYGLMQVRPDAARQVDPSLNATCGSDDSCVANRLRDPNYNIEVGTKYYAGLLNKYDDPDLASAAYNGGPQANRASANCEGALRWQCEYDDNAHTVRNTGYEPTRKYINNIHRYEGAYKNG